MMSCYILPAAQSTFVNLAAVYQPSIVIGGPSPLSPQSWSLAANTVAGGIQLPVAGLGTSSDADQLTTATAVALVTPEVASSFFYRTLCSGAASGQPSTGTDQFPVATSGGSFCCVSPYSSVCVAGNYPFSTETSFPADVGGGAAVYNCSAAGSMSTFRIVATELPQSSSSSSPLASSSSLLSASTTSLCWRRPIDIPAIVGTGSSPKQFYRLRRLLRRVRRRIAAGMTSSSSTDDNDDECGASGSDVIGGRYPLFCVVCRVKLNAVAQAKQHYSGRSHARRVRLLYGPCDESVAGTAADPALSTATRATSGGDSTSNEISLTNSRSDSIQMAAAQNEDVDVVDDAKQHQMALSSPSTSGHRPLFPAGTVAPVSCDVYCSACAVSFNSTTQARQHYHGKSHAKRLRTSLAQQSQTTSGFASPPFGGTSNESTVHKDAIYTCLVCNARPGLMSSHHYHRHHHHHLSSGFSSKQTRHSSNSRRPGRSVQRHQPM